MSAHPRTVSLALLLISILQAGRANADGDPYAVPRESVRTRVKTIALRPVVLPPATADAPAARAAIEGAVTRTLQAKGYAVIPSTEFENIWHRMAQQLGGVFDPITGKLDEKKHAVAYDFTARELATRFRADAALLPAVSQDELVASDGGFKFWAAGEAITWRGEPLRPGLGGANRPQRVLGTYLAVFLHDPQGNGMYALRAPLEWNRVYVARSYEGRPPRDLYKPAHVQRVVDATLDPLVAPQH